MGKPMYNSVLITAVQKTKEGHVELSVPQTWIIQKVIEVGPSVMQVKKGDIVRCNLNALEKAAQPMKLKDKEYLLITERDIVWIYDEEESKELPVYDLLSTI
jgi:co-chaperonin GroES (HSP10)